MWNPDFSNAGLQKKLGEPVEGAPLYRYRDRGCFFLKGISKSRNGHLLTFSDWIQYKQAKSGAIHSLTVPSNNRMKKKQKKQIPYIPNLTFIYEKTNHFF